MGWSNIRPDQYSTEWCEVSIAFTKTIFNPELEPKGLHHHQALSEMRLGPHSHSDNSGGGVQTKEEGRTGQNRGGRREIMTGEKGGVMGRENKQNEKTEIRDF